LLESELDANQYHTPHDTGAPVSHKVYENISLNSAIRDWQETATARARILGQGGQQPLQPLSVVRQAQPEPVLMPPLPSTTAATSDLPSILWNSG
jgi:hypothetical protein